MKPLICFDMDQTLVSSNLAHIYAYKHMLRVLKLLKYKKNWREIIKLRTREEAVKKLCPQFNSKQVENGVKIYLDYLDNISYKRIKIKKYAYQTLKALKPKYKIAIVTNCNAHTAAIFLKYVGLKKFIDCYTGTESVKEPKPSPEVLFAAQKSCKGKLIVEIGDSINDIKAAHSAGVPVISIATGNHNITELKKYKPDFLLKNLKDVPKVVGKIYLNQ